MILLDRSVELRTGALHRLALMLSFTFCIGVFAAVSGDRAYLARLAGVAVLLFIGWMFANITVRPIDPREKAMDRVMLALFVAERTGLASDWNAVADAEFDVASMFDADTVEGADARVGVVRALVLAGRVDTARDYAKLFAQDEKLRDVRAAEMSGIIYGRH
jgi:hypothetical protein